MNSRKDTPDPLHPGRQSRSRRLRIAVIGGGLVVLLLVGVGVYGLLRGPGTNSTPATGHATDSASPAAAPSDPAVGATPAPIPPGGGPVVFARAVATALFAWDTATGNTPADYAQPLADVVSDAEADAFASDVRSYLPTDSAWAQLRQYQTRQWLTIDTAIIPASWETALAQAAPGQIPAGTSAVTITGTRHRAGIWGTTPTTATQSVAFTVFVTCTRPVPDRPGAQLCQVLRLSALDKPLK